MKQLFHDSPGEHFDGMALFGGLIPYGGTFLIFSDYNRPAIRIAALSHIPSIFVFTHDSIGLGEDGPTHQPVEHLAALRAIPNLITLRPADANEVREAWVVAIENAHRPSALVLTRQALPTLDRTGGAYAPAAGLKKGAYVLKEYGDAGKPQIILMASGSEVGLIVEAGKRLAEEGVAVRLLSFPSWELFSEQDPAYRDSVLLPEVELRLAVEAGISQGWHRWIGPKGRLQTLDRYGASAPAGTIFKNLGFSVENITALILDMLK